MLFVSELGGTVRSFLKPHRCHRVVSLRKTHLSFDPGRQCGMCDQRSLRSACTYGQSDQSLCLSLEDSMSVKLLSEHHLEVFSLKGGRTGTSESTLVKMPHYWKSHVTAHI